MPSPTLSPESSTLSSVGSDVDLYLIAKETAKVEERLAEYQPLTEFDKTCLVLRAFAKELPADGAKNMREDILFCASDDRLRDLASNLSTAVLLPLKSKSRTPSVHDSPRFGAEDSVNEISIQLEPSKRQQGWLKRECLRRDGNRCQVTGLYDTKEALKLSPAERGMLRRAPTEAAHVVPFSCGAITEVERLKKSKTWDALYRYFPGIRSRLDFTTSAINEPYNAITLEAAVHTEFGSFHLAFEATGTVNKYRIKTYDQISALVKDGILPGGTVTLSGTAEVPAPSPVLLEAHAAVARILHMSAMGEYLEEILDERDELHCLASDGTTDVKRLLLVF